MTISEAQKEGVKVGKTIEKEIGTAVAEWIVCPFAVMLLWNWAELFSTTVSFWQVLALRLMIAFMK